MREAFTEMISSFFQQNTSLKKLSVSIFTPFPNKKMGELDNELKFHDKNVKDYITRAHTISCLQYNQEFFSPSADTFVPVMFLPAQEFLHLAQNSCLEEINLSGYNLTEPSTMLSLVKFLESNTSTTHLKMIACRLHEMQYAPLRKQLFHAMCNSQSLTDISVDPETAAVLTGFVDRVNYERFTKGHQPLTVHTDHDFFELVVRNWNHS